MESGGLYVCRWKKPRQSKAIAVEKDVSRPWLFPSISGLQEEGGGEQEEEDAIMYLSYSHVYCKFAFPL